MAAAGTAASRGSSSSGAGNLDGSGALPVSSSSKDPLTPGSHTSVHKDAAWHVELTEEGGHRVVFRSATVRALCRWMRKGGLVTIG